MGDIIRKTQRKPAGKPKKPPKSEAARRPWIGRLALAIAAALLLAVLMHKDYLLAHWRYLTYEPVPMDNEEPALTVPDSQQPAAITMTPDTLRIPSMGIEAPIIYVQERNEDAYQAALKQGVAHFPGTAKPGEIGNVYIFGHSSDYSWSDSPYKTVFATLPLIKLDDRIIVSDSQGHPFTYRITETKVVSPKDLTVLAAPDSQKRMLTVQTSYPLGTALKRFLAIGELIESN